MKCCNKCVTPDTKSESSKNEEDANISRSEFIEINKKLWADDINENCDKNLLIEEMGAPFLFHGLGNHSIILNKARGYKPLWIPRDNIPLALLRSYVPSADHALLYKLNLWEKTKVLLSSVVAYIKVLLKRDILSFKYDGIKYGDLVYDGYLDRKKVGTIKHIDLLVLSYIKKCIRRHVIITKTLKLNNISAVLVSHRIGIMSAVILRAALKQGCEVYSEIGYHRATLTRCNKMEDIIKYELSASAEDLKKLTSLPQEKFDQVYEFVKRFHIHGDSNMDAKYAFSSDNKFYEDRESFAKAYNLDPNKKNVFVMLHAFTDFPHSHFKWMIFKDYADWFLKTLEYAKKDNTVNWIFKRHPSDKFYPTKDIDFKKLFKNAPNNVIFLDNDDQLDTRSLIHISDAIITCLGSAGFEIPAMAGVPSITAGDNHYYGLNFSINPKTKKEYFETLSKLKDVKKLSAEQQKTAKAVYMFIHYFSCVNFSSMPVLTHAQHHKPNPDEWFWDMAIELYKSNPPKIKEEINAYASIVAKEDFSALRSTLSELEDKGLLK